MILDKISIEKIDVVHDYLFIIGVYVTNVKLLIKLFCL